MIFIMGGMSSATVVPLVAPGLTLIKSTSGCLFAREEVQSDPTYFGQLSKNRSWYQKP